MNVIETHELTKRYGEFEAVKGINLRVPSRSIYAFLGPNGAGKTTTIRMLTGMLVPTSGYALVMGYNPELEREKVLEHIGYAPDDPGFPGHLTGMQVLVRCARLSGMSRSDAKLAAKHVLEIVGLTEHAKKKTKHYSHGMRKRLCIAAAIIHNPEVVILDEPTSGLDPEYALRMRELVRRLGKEGHTIFMSTHMLVEAERVCTHLGVIVDGVLVAQGEKENLLSRLAEENTIRVKVSGISPKLVQEKVSELDFVKNVELLDGGALLISLLGANPNHRKGYEYRARISRLIHSMGGAVVSMSSRRLSLEDFYFRVVNGHRNGGKNERPEE